MRGSRGKGKPGTLEAHFISSSHKDTHFSSSNHKSSVKDLVQFSNQREPVDLLIDKGLVTKIMKDEKRISENKETP